MSDDKPDNVQTTSNTQPWSAQIPLWKKSFQQANNLFDSGALRIQPYAGDRTAPVAPETSAGWQATVDRATAGSPVRGLASDYYQNVLRGDYLGADTPGLAAIKDRARTAVNANFAGMGRAGSGAHDAAIANSFADIEYQNYARERAIQDAAAGGANQFAAGDYLDPSMLGQVGAERQADLQKRINDQIALQQELQRVLPNELALYQSFIGGNLGGTTTATQPGQPGVNPLLLGLGTAASLGGSALGNPGLWL